MIKIMKKITVIALLSSLFFTGCQDYLTQDPNLDQTTDLTLSTYSGLDSSIAGAYSPLASKYWYGCYFVLDSEMRAGNAKRPTSSAFGSGRMTTPYFMTYNESSTVYVWSYAYYVISAANNVMENISGIELSSEVTQQDLDNLKAEALFLRAFCHFDLVRTYAHSYAKDADGMGVPIILYTDKTATEQPARNTVAEVYTQIIADLKEAETLMDASYCRDFTDEKASITLPAIQALLSRAYLYTQQWQNAADYATTVINSGDFTLWTAEELADADTWGADLSSGGEIIFEIYAATGNSYDGYWECTSYMTNPEGYGDCAASTDLADLYEESDVRGTLFRTDSANESGGELWTTRFPGKGKSTPDVNNTIILRLSEMYLTRAEALANGASISGASALTDLNTIATRCGASAYTAAGNTNILLERRKELAYEAHYWFDMARTSSSLSYSDAAVTRELSSTAGLWAMPIPKSELDVNKNLVQNVY